MIRKYRNKNVVIAMHHPLYTYGPHGGSSTVDNHIFPLAQLKNKIYFPLPGIGTLGVLYRDLIGHRQDVANSSYRQLRSALLAGAKKNGSFIFASGHEHALEYIENESQQFIVSGSGSKNSAVRLGKGAEFVSGASGYSTIQFYEGGEAWVQFFQVNEDGKEATLVYRKKIKDSLPLYKEKVPTDFPEYDQHKDSVEQPVVKNEIKPISGVHKFLLGTHHRELYMKQYPFPVLDL